MSDRLRNRYTKTCRAIAQSFLIMPAQYSPDVEADKTFRARSPTGPLLVGLAVRERTGGQRVSYFRRLIARREDRRSGTFPSTGSLRTGYFSKRRQAARLRSGVATWQDAGRQIRFVSECYKGSWRNATAITLRAEYGPMSTVGRHSTPGYAATASAAGPAITHLGRRTGALEP